MANNSLKIPGLSGQGKMGKSNGDADCIYLSDPEATVRKKIMRAVTDSGPTQANQEKPEAIQNLFDLMKVVSSLDTLEHFEERYNGCDIRYGDFKKQLAEDMVQATHEVRSRIEEINQDEDYIKKVLRHGAEKAHASASKTLKEVREIIGLKKLY